MDSPRFRAVLGFVKVEHSLFALPFVLAGFVLGLVEAGLPWAFAESGRLLALAVVAAVSARTAAMTVNRIVDREIDARNPRTSGRHLPSGALSLRFAWTLALASFAVLGASAWLLNPLCLALAPVLVALFVVYPYTKRFTWTCHFVLGLAFLSGVVGGYLAVTGTLAGFDGTPREFWGAALVGLAAMAWVAGFDVLYALLDVEVDRTQGIRSIPARFGVPVARAVSAALHGGTVLFLAAAGIWLALLWTWWVALAVVVALLAYEHASADPADPASVERAFFRVNAVVGWIVLAGLLGALA